MNIKYILAVDDEEDLCEILKFNLENEEFKVDIAHSAEEALKLDLSKYSLLLLDVMMGEISGFRMARILKDDTRTAAIPIIFMTAKDTENDRLTGFAIGADDYITKPYSIREVVARVKAVIKHYSTDTQAPAIEITYETLVINQTNKKILLNKQEIYSTKKEFEILKLLLENRNRVFSRQEILSQIWSDEDGVLNRTVDVNITRLRKKIGPYGRHIVTRLGYGYCFEG